MKHFLSAAIIFLGYHAFGTNYVFTFSGVVTHTYFNLPVSPIAVGSPFTAVFNYQMPGTPLIQDPDQQWYSFSDSEQKGSALVGTNSFSFSGEIMIFSSSSNSASLQLQSTGQGLNFRSTLTTSNPSLMPDLAHISTTITAQDFDVTSLFEVFGTTSGGNLSFDARIDSVSFMVIPEPSVLSLVGIASAIVVWRCRSRTTAPSPERLGS